ncbi:MAG: phage tail assembly protein [Magnetospirillum sp.]|nr:phage tail assembly protein [Magnetospirillum sp.]
MNTEDWKKIGVEWQEDGSAIIALTFPINVGGAKSTKVQMHCPSLDQVEAINADKTGDPVAREKRGIAGMMGLAPEELGQIKFPDYRRVQMVYADFLAGTPPMFIGAACEAQSGFSPAISTSPSTT